MLNQFKKEKKYDEIIYMSTLKSAICVNACIQSALQIIIIKNLMFIV